MKVKQFKKNSEEWLEYRKGKSGGSGFRGLYIEKTPTITELKKALDGRDIAYDKRAKLDELLELAKPEITAEIKANYPMKKHFWEILAERVARPITPNDYLDRLNGEPFSMMARGHLLEPEAIALLAKKTKTPFIPTGDVWEDDNNPNLYISPDGVVPGDLTIAAEIKCLNSASMLEAFFTGEYPKEHKPQILKYFMVNDKLKSLVFGMYSDAIPGLELIFWQITRDEIKAEIEEAKLYEKLVMKQIDSYEAEITKLQF